MYLAIITLVMLAATINRLALDFYYGSSFPQCGQNFTSGETTRPQLGQTLVIGAAAGGAFSFLTMRYMINPIMPVRITTISHSTPLIPRDSASLYTQTQSRIATTNQMIGIRHNPPRSHSIWSTGSGVIFLTLAFILYCFLYKTYTLEEVLFKEEVAS